MQLKKYRSVNEFSVSEYEKLKFDLATYNAGPILKTMAEFNEKMLECKQKRKELREYCSKLDQWMCYNSSLLSGPDRDEMSMVLLSFPKTKEKAVLFVEDARCFSYPYYGFSSRYVAMDPRVPIDFKGRYECSNVDSDQQQFYFRDSVDEYFDGLNPQNHHYPQNLYAISDEVYDAISNGTDYVVFGRMRTDFFLNHAMSSPSSFTIHYEDASGNGKDIALKNKTDSTTLRYSNPIDADTGLNRGIVIDMDDMDARIAIASSKFSMHKSRNYICYGQPGKGYSCDTTFLISESPSSLFWSSREDANHSLRNFPAIMKKINTILDGIEKSIEKVYCFTVAIGNRSRFHVAFAKGTTFLPMTIETKQDLEFLNSAIAKAITSDDYVKITNERDFHIFYICKEAIPKTTLSFRTESAYSNADSAHKYAQIVHGKKVLYETENEEEKQIIIDAYKEVLSDDEFNNMYALALLKS